jgi:hypothetical protein
VPANNPNAFFKIHNFFSFESDTMANNPDDRHDDLDEDNPQLNDGRYAIDIRVFLAIISLTMAASFFAGVAMLPMPNTTRGPVNTVHVYLPKVNSNVMNSSGIPKDLDDLHLPAGQHLLVDIRNVEAAFLNSESRLADAMVQTVRESGYVKKLTVRVLPYYYDTRASPRSCSLTSLFLTH